MKIIIFFQPSTLPTLPLFQQPIPPTPPSFQSQTNGLLIVPDGEVPEGTEKIYLKLLYEMFKDTQSHGLVSIQFLCALGIFFGLNISILKYALTELYKNLSYETLSGARDLEFEAISDLVSEISFQIKNSTLLNIKRKKEQDKESSLDIKKSHDFFEKLDKLEEELEEDLYKDLEHKKLEHSYVEPQVQDAETIEKETKKRTKNFLILIKNITKQTMLQLNKKKQNYFVDLFDVVLDEDNPFSNTMKTEDILTDDNLFDDTDQKEIKQVSEDVLQDMNKDQNETLFVDLPEEWSEKVEIAPKIAPKANRTPRIITPNARLENAAIRTKKKISKTKTNKRTLK